MTINLKAKTAANTEKEWSHATREVLDTLPRLWTRGLLYFSLAFVAIILPWAMLAKVDETGTAQGKLEPQGETIKLDSTTAGKVKEIPVKEGDSVKTGQTLLVVDSQLVQTELRQVKDKLAGQKNRLSQSKLLKSQIVLSLSTQQQQNQAQELEKQSQIEQARQNLETLQGKYELQKAEKLAQVNQAKALLEKSQTDSQILNTRWQNSLREFERYRRASLAGLIAEAQVAEKEDAAKEMQRLYEQSKGEIKQNQQRLGESKSLYQQALKQAKADIAQAALQLQEQQRSYQSLKQANTLNLLKIEEQSENLETEIGGIQAEIAQVKSQIEGLQIELAQRVIKAPVSGTIFQLPIKKAGAVVQPGTRIVEIAPDGSRFILRAQIATNESGSLKKGLPVKLKFDAYPFQDYGIVEGKLAAISPTTQEMDTPNGKIFAYWLEIELNHTCILTANKCIPLHPGDTATAEVILRQKRVVDFVIEPIKKLQKGGLKL